VAPARAHLLRASAQIPGPSATAVPHSLGIPLAPQASDMRSPWPTTGAAMVQPGRSAAVNPLNDWEQLPTHLSPDASLPPPAGSATIRVILADVRYRIPILIGTLAFTILIIVIGLMAIH
jgi:hypothetical protein